MSAWDWQGKESIFAKDPHFNGGHFKRSKDATVRAEKAPTSGLALPNTAMYSKPTQLRKDALALGGHLGHK